MARPIKDGVDYFPLDVNFLFDDKIRLLKAEFGAKGVIIFIALLCEIYRESGYYKVWSEESCYLMADTVGCGMLPKEVARVVQGCVDRGIFDHEIYQKFGILTSAGIQRRYIRAVCKRDEITLISEYLLLDVTSKKDFPASILNKCVFCSLTAPEEKFLPEKTGCIPEKTGINSSNNPQSKGKERKGKKIERNPPEIPAEKTPDKIPQEITEFYENHFGTVSRHTADEMVRYLQQKIEPALIVTALKIAVKNHARRWAYANAILKDCLKKGIATVSEFEEERRKESHERSGKNSGASSAGTCGKDKGSGKKYGIHL